MKNTRLIVAVLGLMAFSAEALDNSPTPGPGQGYATDAYPGFDAANDLAATKKEPKWFGWINGPNRDNAKDQLDYCVGLIADENYSKAAKHLDALVRAWPESPEAPKAQQLLAELQLSRLHDPAESFSEYRYLVDFYSFSCDFHKMLDKMYKVAQQMRIEGKTIVFFHFDNTVDTRRAFEACVLRAPGASWAPEAMLQIASLREEDGQDEEAVKVYENLRNLYFGSPEAVKATGLEAKARMRVLEEHEYNRSRCRDTINFLKLALRQCDISEIEEIKDMLARANAQIEAEAYRSAKFYDSPTRTPRSAINAYERFLQEYPGSSYAPQVEARLEALREKEVTP